jgi:Ca-activated chloride channel family protein
MHWAHPQALLLLLLVPLVFWPLRAAWRGVTRFPGVSQSLTQVAPAAAWGPVILATFRGLGLILLILALARPQTLHGRTQRTTEGIAIQLVLDTSLSMGIADYTLGDRAITRLDAAKHAIRLFVRGDEQHQLPGRPHDLIGLVTFNRHPDVVCPLTLAHETLLSALHGVTLGPYTNIGDGLAWGLDRLRQAPPREKILILVSDGKQNVKEALGPHEAAQLATQLGIRIYTIGAVGNRFDPERRPTLAELVRQAQPARSGQRQPADTVDEDTLRRVAEATGGKYFRATETDGLLAIYREIDALEKTRITDPRPAHRQEWYFVLLIPGLLLFFTEQLLAATRFLVIP